MKALYKSYPSNLTSDQWAIMEPYLPAAKPGGRPPRVNLRAVLDAIFYFLYSGCAWRRFQGTFPLGLSVYTYFQGWREQGVWERINPYLRQWVRLRRNRSISPSAAIIDTQSVKIGSLTNLACGARSREGGERTQTA